VNKVFIDVNIPMYAGGAAHSLKVSCQEIIKAIGGGRLEAYTDVEVLAHRGLP